MHVVEKLFNQTNWLNRMQVAWALQKKEKEKPPLETLDAANRKLSNHNNTALVDGSKQSKINK